jgi:hypothetical protein
VQHAHNSINFIFGFSIHTKRTKEEKCVLICTFSAFYVVSKVFFLKKKPELRINPPVKQVNPFIKRYVYDLNSFNLNSMSDSQVVSKIVRPKLETHKSGSSRNLWVFLCFMD